MSKGLTALQGKTSESYAHQESSRDVLHLQKTPNEENHMKRLSAPSLKAFKHMNGSTVQKSKAAKMVQRMKVETSNFTTPKSRIVLCFLKPGSLWQKKTCSILHLRVLSIHSLQQSVSLPSESNISTVNVSSVDVYEEHHLGSKLCARHLTVGTVAMLSLEQFWRRHEIRRSQDGLLSWHGQLNTSVRLITYLSLVQGGPTNSLTLCKMRIIDY